MDERAARLAENEAVFRAGNTAINGNLADVVEEVPYLCECGVDSCFERVAVPREAYEAVRAHPARFFVAPGHEDLSAGEVVVERRNDYTIVEKSGAEREIVANISPEPSPGS